MNGRCYKCNNPLTTGDFDGMCNDCRKQQNDTEISIVDKPITELKNSNHGEMNLMKLFKT